MNKFAQSIILACSIVIGMMGLTRPAHAQNDGMKPWQRIEQFKKMKLLETLDLDEATANKFLVKYDKWEKDISQLNQERIILVQQLRLAVEKNSGDAALNALLDSLYDYTVQVDNAHHEMFADLRSILTPAQSAKLALFEAKFQRKLRESLEKLHDRRDRPDPMR